MPTGFPASVDNFANPGPSNNLSDAGVVHSAQHANANDAIEAIETWAKKRGIWHVDSDYAAVGNGSTTDTTACQAAIDACSAAGGGIVQFGPHTYRVNLVWKPNVHLRGMGWSTVLKAVAGSNEDVIKGYNFASLTGKSYASGDKDLGTVFGQLTDLVIDGDKATQSAGYGVRVWGSKFKWDHVHVRDCKSGGIWTEFTTHDAGNFNDLLESHYRSIKVSGCSGDAWTYKGPHDSTLIDYVAVSNTGWAMKTYNGKSINGGWWNSWLNTNSFYFAGPAKIVASVASGESGIGVELAAGTGGVEFQGDISVGGGGTSYGLIARGSNHKFNINLYQCTEGVRIGTAGGGNECSYSFFDIVGSGNTTGVIFTNSAGMNTMRGYLPTGTLYTGTPSGADSVQLYKPGGSAAGNLWQTPFAGIYVAATGYTPQWPASNGKLLTWHGVSSSATAGSATALPALPVGYVSIVDDTGTIRKVPYYN